MCGRDDDETHDPVRALPLDIIRIAQDIGEDLVQAAFELSAHTRRPVGQRREIDREVKLLSQGLQELLERNVAGIDLEVGSLPEIELQAWRLARSCGRKGEEEAGQPDRKYRNGFHSFASLKPLHGISSTAE
jgi:hypothetical protein